MNLNIQYGAPTRQRFSEMSGLNYTKLYEYIEPSSMLSKLFRFQRCYFFSELKYLADQIWQYFTILPFPPLSKIGEKWAKCRSQNEGQLSIIIIIIEML